MSHLRSTALAAICALSVVGFSGYLAPASAEPVNPPGTKVYADSASLSGKPGMTPAQAVLAMPSKENTSESSVMSGAPTGCDLRCRTGFFGYH
jgi:hypothetical protein